MIKVCKSIKNKYITAFLVGLVGVFLFGTGEVNATSDSLAAQRVTFFPFNDITLFKHKIWKLQNDVPQFFSDHLISKSITIVPFDSVLSVLKDKKPRSLLEKPKDLQEFGKKMGVSYIVVGDIHKFKITKKTAVMPELGGYKQYNADLEIEVKIFDCDLGDYSYTTMLMQELGTRGLKFNPPGKISSDEADFLALEREAFATDAFMRTVIGEAMKRMTSDLLLKLEAFGSHGGAADKVVAGDTVAAKVVATEAHILQIEGGSAYINAGRDERIKPGDTFEVYTEGDPIFDPMTKEKLGYAEKKVGLVKVAKVKAAHFSRVKIMEGEGVIKVMDSVRLQ